MDNHQYVYAIGEPSDYLEKLGVDTNKETTTMNEMQVLDGFDLKGYAQAVNALRRLGKAELEVILNFDIEEILKEKQ